MPKLELLTICDSVSVDSTTNQLSLFKILESLNYPGPFPTLYPKATLVMVWRRDEDSTDEVLNFTSRITLVSPGTPTQGANETQQNVIPVEIPSGSRRTRVISDLIGFPIFGAGKLKIEVQQKIGTRWSDKEFIIIDVTDQPMPESGGAVPL